LFELGIEKRNRNRNRKKPEPCQPSNIQSPAQEKPKTQTQTQSCGPLLSLNPKPNQAQNPTLLFSPARQCLTAAHTGPPSAPAHPSPAPTPRSAPHQRPTRRPTCQRPRSLSRAPTLSTTPGPCVSALLSPSFPAPQRPPEITGEVVGILIPLRPAAIPARPL